MTPPLYWTVWYNLETAYFLMLWLYVLLKIRLNLERNGGGYLILILTHFLTHYVLLLTRLLLILTRLLLILTRSILRLFEVY